MTSIDNVQDVTPRVQYTASASQTGFDYPFPIFADADLVVDIDGVTQVLTTEYTVSGKGEDNGGTVTLIRAIGDELAGGEVVTIYRDTAISRTSDIQQNGPLSSTTYNDETDNIFLILQELENKIGRAIRFPQTAAITNAQAELSPLSNYLGKFLRITSAGILEAADVLSNTVAFTAETIGALLNPQTSAEVTAGVTPTSYKFSEGNVLRYGADPTGATDSASAIRDAISVANAAVLSGNSGVWGVLSTTNGVSVPVYFPTGIYTVGSALTTAATAEGLSYMQFIGDRAVLVDTTLAVNCFEAIAYDTLFRGITFRGFAKQIVIDTNNVNRAKIDIIECGLIDPATNCVETSTDSNSTILNVQRCNISTSGASVVAFDCYVDHMVVRDSWIQTDSDVTFINRDDLKLHDNVLVPSGTNTGRVWVENRGFSLEASNNIFGGEGAGRVFVDHYTTMDAAGTINPVWISLHDFEGYSNNYIVKLNTLPNHLKLNNILDDTPTATDAAIWVASGITAQELEDYARHGTVDIDERWPRSRVINNPTVAAMIQIKNLKSHPVNIHTDRIDETLVLASGDTNTANWVGTATATESAGTNIFGADTSIYTATADDQSLSVSDSNFLVRGDLGLEPLTHCHEITWEPASSVGNMELLVTVGNEAYYVSLLPGTHMYSFPFVYLNGGGGSDDTTLDNIQFQSGGRMLNGDVVKFGRWYLLQGVHFMSNINLRMIANATPSAIAGTTGSNQAYYPGDEWYDLSPTAAASPGEICVTEGDPGTWKAKAVLAA